MMSIHNNVNITNIADQDTHKPDENIENDVSGYSFHIVAGKRGEGVTRRMYVEGVRINGALVSLAGELSLAAEDNGITLERDGDRIANFIIEN